MIKLKISTNKRTDFVDITSQIQNIVAKSHVESGIATIFVPHTTCGITINEGADPDVKTDIKNQLEKLVPPSDRYRHLEGNADSHIKTFFAGNSENFIIEQKKLMLGTWQSIFLCDFDGPRTRKIFVQIVG